VTRWLVGHGYNRTDIAKVLGLNIVRVLKDAWWR
jgi:microsomal dipeptidase-like Zn-dependent dipeptidase